MDMDILLCVVLSEEEYWSMLRSSCNIVDICLYEEILVMGGYDILFVFLKLIKKCKIFRMFFFYIVIRYR